LSVDARCELTKCKQGCVNEKEDAYKSTPFLFHYYVALQLILALCSFQELSLMNIFDIMVVTINLSNLPHGALGKEPPLNRVKPNQSPPEPPILVASGDNPGRSDPNLELFRQMVE